MLAVRTDTEYSRGMSPAADEDTLAPPVSSADAHDIDDNDANDAQQGISYSPALIAV